MIHYKVTLADVLSMARSNAASAEDQAHEYSDPVASFRQNVLDTLAEYNVTDCAMIDAALCAYDNALRTVVTVASQEWTDDAVTALADSVGIIPLLEGLARYCLAQRKRTGSTESIDVRRDWFRANATITAMIEILRS